jgi:Ser/Thr protein kinase RdoA (MazF antagonist)
VKRVPEAVLSALAPGFGAAPEELAFLGGGQDFSDGTVYRFPGPTGDQVLKILGPFPPGDAALEVAQARLACVKRLADAGSPLVRPFASRAGSIFERGQAGGQVYLAYAYPFAPGRAAEPSDAAVRSGAYARALGAAVARLHAASEQFEETLRQDGTSGRQPALGGWRDEWAFFRGWCHDAEVGAAWERLRGALERLPVERGEYGFVHNDVHPGNAMLDPAAAAGGAVEPELRLIDFDVAGYNWFLNDAAGAIYGIATLRSGGLESPAGPTAADLEAAGKPFWEGYRRHRSPGETWTARLPLFLQYRRCLLFMPFQELTAAHPEWRARWRARIAAADAELFGLA